MALIYEYRSNPERPRTRRFTTHAIHNPSYQVSMPACVWSNTKSITIATSQVRLLEGPRSSLDDYGEEFKAGLKHLPVRIVDCRIHDARYQDCMGGSEMDPTGSQLS